MGILGDVKLDKEEFTAAMAEVAACREELAAWRAEIQSWRLYLAQTKGVRIQFEREA